MLGGGNKWKVEKWKKASRRKTTKKASKLPRPCRFNNERIRIYLLHLSFWRHLIATAIHHNLISLLPPLSTSFRTPEKRWKFFFPQPQQKQFFFFLPPLQIHDALEHDNDDNDSSGSGYGGDDDEDEIRKDTAPRVNKEPTNTHHSGDGSNNRDDDDDDDDYIENHEDERKPLPIDGEDEIYFENSSTNPPSTSTSSNDNIAPSITTDDEDSQFNFFYFSYYLLLGWQGGLRNSCGKFDEVKIIWSGKAVEFCGKKLFGNFW